jgi:hypothetical protein
MMLDTAVTNIMSLVKVWTEVDENGKCQSLPAKIVSKKGNVFKIQYLSPTTGERDSKNRRIYMYEDETYEVTNDSITEYLDSDTELDFGFEEIGNGKFVKCDILGTGECEYDDDDEDYVPSTENEDSSDDDESEEDSGEDTDEYDEYDDGNFSD